MTMQPDFPVRSNTFTPQAKRVWEAIPMRTRTVGLNQVWCKPCGRTTTIVLFHGVIRRGQLVIRGRCQRCSQTVSRVFQPSGRQQK